MLKIAVLVVIAVAALFHPDYNSNPVTWLLSGLVILGAVGLVWRYWLSIRADQAMIDTERNTRR